MNQTEKNKILILCKVVDNFGDIGVVYRLAKTLCDSRPDLELTLVVSNLKTFSSIAGGINPDKKIQFINYKDSTWTVVDWDCPHENLTEELLKSIKETSIILECFQCGRPDFLEKILFDDDFTKTVQILNIDYLTAEDYADDFHLLKSGTRKTNIKKRFFMPGFTKNTGGLVISKCEKEIFNRKKEMFFSEKNSGHPAQKTKNNFEILFFSYERDCTPIVKAIDSFQKKMRAENPLFSVNVHVAAGEKCEPFKKAFRELSPSFKIEELPLLTQDEWDKMLYSMDFLCIRGEDSLARACLSGIPFLWHAYVQDGEYQLVKVNALLERMKNHFSEEDFAAIKKIWITYNKKNLSSPDEEREIQEEIECGLEVLLQKTASPKKTMCKSFMEFASSLYEIGSLTENLLTYIDSVEFQP